MDVDKQLTKLLARLPELEWQLGKLGYSFSVKSLPRALFRQPFDAPATAYAAEIREDIRTLSSQTNQRAVHHLAVKISQKINVLVTICSRHNREKPDSDVVSYGVDKISTRQQWLQSLEANIEILDAQRTSLANALAQKGCSSDDSLAQLSLQRELGELERRLTLARETWQRAIGPN